MLVCLLCRSHQLSLLIPSLWWWCRAMMMDHLSSLSARPQNIYIFYGIVGCSHAAVENRNLGLPLQKYHLLHNTAILVSSFGTVCTVHPLWNLTLGCTWIKSHKIRREASIREAFECRGQTSKDGVPAVSLLLRESLCHLWCKTSSSHQHYTWPIILFRYLVYI